MESNTRATAVFAVALLTWAVVGPSQHALHLVDRVLPATGAGLHVWVELLQPLVQVPVPFQCQLCHVLGHHQFLQIVLQDDHPVHNRGRIDQLLVQLLAALLVS